MSKASKTTLEELHEKLAEKLKTRIESDDVTASDLNVARQFLKDNGIDALNAPGSPINDLQRSLPDLPDASDETDYYQH